MNVIQRQTNINQSQVLIDTTQDDTIVFVNQSDFNLAIKMLNYEKVK